ncbi:MAG TPA: hypothetical protein VIY73_12800 [Polyangiaceae bacterium]
MNWLRITCSVLASSLLLAAWSCGSTSSNGGFPQPGPDGSTSSSSGGTTNADGSTSSGDDGPSYGQLGDAAPPPYDGSGGCKNLQCQVHSCGGGDGAAPPADGGTVDAGPNTTISGTVYDPAGRNPLYNVVVYIPNAQGGKLDAIPIGINANSCSCGALFSGEPIAYAITDTAGKFTLTNVPDGANIPLVVQIGKWRKEITIPSVAQCANTDAGKITLPKNLTDGAFASMPNIAISTGGADTLECLLTRVGIDEAAFTGDPNGPGIHVFHGSGGNSASGSPAAPTSLWDSQADLMRYDIMMLSCEGSPTAGVSATTATYLAPYVNSGGRVFAEHYHYAFFTNYTGKNPAPYAEFPNVAGWTNLGLAGNDSPYTNDITGVIETTLPSGTPFPEGAALKSWLGNVGALNASGEIVVPVANARDTALVSATNVATPWVQTDPSIKPASTQYFSWDMPFDAGLDEAGAPQYCGRVVYSDMHVSGSAADYQGGSSVVPTGCDATAALTPDEDAIEFILFDLSSCITPVGFTPQPPPPEGGVAN